jgi:cyclopropane fatty-acyl-phospholipid synthase-like methyltransferase
MPSSEKFMNSSYRDKIYNQYVDTYSIVYHKESLEAELSLRSKLYDINYKTLFPQKSDLNILELGCGPGFFLKYLQNRGYSNYLGIDGSAQQLSLASSMDVKNILNEDIFSFLRTTSRRFDVICSFHVLEHFTKIEIIDLLKLIHKNLNKGGRLIIEVPNSGSPLFGANNRYSEFTHETGFSATSLKELFLFSGFMNVSVLPAKAASLWARVFFRTVNYILHSRFSKDMFIDGELIGIGYKKD